MALWATQPQLQPLNYVIAGRVPIKLYLQSETAGASAAPPNSGGSALRSVACSLRTLAMELPAPRTSVTEEQTQAVRAVGCFVDLWPGKVTQQLTFTFLLSLQRKVYTMRSKTCQSGAVIPQPPLPRLREDTFEMVQWGQMRKDTWNSNSRH